MGLQVNNQPAVLLWNAEDNRGLGNPGGSRLQLAARTMEWRVVNTFSQTSLHSDLNNGANSRLVA